MSCNKVETVAKAIFLFLAAIGIGGLVDGYAGGVQPRLVLQPEAAPVLVSQVGHASAYWGGVPCLALSEDGKLLVSGGDFSACLWETATGREIRSFRGKSTEIQAVALSSDVKLLATAGGDNIVRLWDVAAGKEIRVFNHTWVHALAFSSDGKHLVSAGSFGVVRLWDVETGIVIREFKGHNDNRVNAVALTRDGKWLITGGGDAARLWNLATGEEVRTFPSDPVQGLAVSRDSKWVVICSCGAGLNFVGGKTQLCELTTGKEIRTFENANERVTFVALSADDKWLITGNYYRNADLWELATGKHVRNFQDKKSVVRERRVNPRTIFAVVMSGDGKWLVTASPEKTIQMWDSKTGATIREFQGLANAARRMALSRNNEWLVTAGEETCSLWDLTKGCSVRTFRGHESGIMSIALSRDNKWLVSAGGFDEKTRLWDVANGNEIRAFEHPGSVDIVYSVAISNNSQWVATGCHDGTTVLWDRLTGKRIRDLPNDDGWVKALAFSSDDKWLITTARDGARLSDVSTGKEIRFFQHKDHVVWNLLLSADDKWLVTCGFDKTARLWELATGKEVRVFAGHAHGVTSIDLSSDGKWLITGSEDRTARLWDLATGKQIRDFVGHDYSVSNVAFTRDGKKLLTAGSGDCSVRLWELATGKELCRLHSFKDGNWATFDTNGRYDSFNGQNVEGIHWTVGNETRPLSHFSQRYYDPGLLAKYLGFNKQALRKIGDGQ